MVEISEPVALRPRATADGEVDVSGLRWTIQRMHGELAGKTDLARVRNALAIALMELDRAEQSPGFSARSQFWARYPVWPRR